MHWKTGDGLRSLFVISSESRKILMDWGLLICAVIVVFGRLTGYGFQSHFDDNVYVINNAAAHGINWGNVKSAFNLSISMRDIYQYNPISIISFMIDFSLWKMTHPGGYHFTNIVIHTLNGLMVYRLILRFHGQRTIALLSAAVFLLHPVQVESVAWISERKGLLSLFFLLISWELYCRYREMDQGGGRFTYAASVFTFLLSLLAKTASVVLPLILILFEMCFKNKEQKVRILDKIPFIVASAIFTVIEIYTGTMQNDRVSISYHGGSPLATFYTMLTVFCRYLMLLIWPTELNIEHLPPVYRSPDLAVIGAALLLISIAVFGCFLFKSDRKIGFWFLFFWIGLLPVSQIIPQILLMYEHYLYMPIIGFAVLTGFGAVHFRSILGEQRAAIINVSLVLWLLTLSFLSFQRTAVWKDSITLFTDATAKSPDGFRVWKMLGELHRSSGNSEASRVALERCLQLKPDSTDILWALADLYTELGQLDKGKDYLHRLLAIDPKYVMGWSTLGNNYLGSRNFKLAKEMYTNALVLQPDALEVYTLLGKLAVAEKHFDEARANFNVIEADKRHWRLDDNAYQMVRTESLAGRVDEAFVWLEKALLRGYNDYYTLNTNMELSVLWDSPRFAYLMHQYFPEEEKTR